MTIKAIETRYAGCRFRSRLEARWAVFFDTMGIRWEYEPKGFVTAAGPYLPDFRLPDLRLFVEVKGVDPNQRDLDRCREIALACQRHGGDLIILVGDIPRDPPVTGLRLVPENPFDEDSETFVWESRRFWELKHATRNGVGRALDAARSARFEHGETGAPRRREDPAYLEAQRDYAAFVTGDPNARAYLGCPYECAEECVPTCGLWTLRDIVTKSAVQLPYVS